MSQPRASWAERVREHHDEHGRVFRYVHVRHPGAQGLVIHFSAFFGEWGDTATYRKVFGGHFHRLRMLGEVEDHDWLFLCDEYGADGNGTYYTGEAGDLFVERAMVAVIREAAGESAVEPSAMVTMGSSMGATAALKFGLMLDVKGIVAISPHVDLDICAVTQGRQRHVAFICPDGDPAASNNHVYTRQIRRLIAELSDRPPPRLFVQACRDDHGVFHEQVEPLCVAWREAGGAVTLDARRSGGHTSDHATRPLLLDSVACILAERPFDVRRYQRDRAFRGPSSVDRMMRRLRAVTGRVLRRTGLRRR